MAIAPVASHEPTIAATSPNPIGAQSQPKRDWLKISPTEESIPGARYRMTLHITAPYTPFMIDTLTKALQIGAGLNNLNPFNQLHEKIRIEQIIAHYPKSGVSGRNWPNWDLAVIYTKTTHGTPVLVIYGIVAAIIAAVALVTITGYTVEKEGEKIGTLARTTVFNPGFLIAAVIIVLAVTGKNLKGLAKGGA